MRFKVKAATSRRACVKKVGLVQSQCKSVVEVRICHAIRKSLSTIVSYPDYIFSPRGTSERLGTRLSVQAQLVKRCPQTLSPLRAEDVWERDYQTLSCEGNERASGNETS